MRRSRFLLAALAGALLILAAQGPASAVERSAAVPTTRSLPRTSPMHSARVDAAPGQTARRAAREVAPPKNAEAAPSKVASTLSPWTTVTALAFVIGLVLLAARLLRRGGLPFRQGIPADALEVLGRRIIDARQSVLLLRIGGRILVVGSSPSGLQPLSEISDPLEVDLIGGLCRDRARDSSVASAFRNLIQGQLRAESAPAPPMNRPPAAARPTAQPVPIPSPLETRRSMFSPEAELTQRLRAGAGRRTEAHAGDADD